MLLNFCTVKWLVHFGFVLWLLFTHTTFISIFGHTESWKTSWFWNWNLFEYIIIRVKYFPSTECFSKSHFPCFGKTQFRVKLQLKYLYTVSFCLNKTFYFQMVFLKFV